MTAYAWSRSSTPSTGRSRKMACNRPRVKVATRITLGTPNQVDPLALVGERPGRMIPDDELQIGPNAVIRAFSVIYLGTRIGSHLETGHGVVIREENLIGDHLSIWNQSTIDYGCVSGNR